MTEIFQTEEFSEWVSGLKDRSARARIQARIDRLAMGNPGDVAPIGKGRSEMRIHYGPGYRVYYMKKGNVIVVLLCGGDKSTQNDDIMRAHELADSWEKLST